MVTRATVQAATGCTYGELVYLVGGPPDTVRGVGGELNTDTPSRGSVQVTVASRTGEWPLHREPRRGGW